MLRVSKALIGTRPSSLQGRGRQLFWGYRRATGSGILLDESTPGMVLCEQPFVWPASILPPKCGMLPELSRGFSCGLYR